jgi:hypothetical protein
VIALLFLLPVVLVYKNVSDTHNFERSIRDSAHFSLGLDDYADTIFSPALYILFGLALFKIGKDKKVFDKETKWTLLVFAISFIFSLGPVLKWDSETVKLLGVIPVPLPYSVFYYLVPGLKALRATSRWVLLSSVAATFLFSYAYRKLNTNTDKLKIIALLAIALIGGTRLKKVHLVDKNDIPKVYEWLSTTDYNTILELPMYTWVDKGIRKNDFYRLYYSLSHKKSMVGGTSGFVPHETNKLIAESRKSDSIDQIIDLIDFFGPKLLIVHKDQQRELLGKDINLRSLDGKVVWEDMDTTVIELK